MTTPAARLGIEERQMAFNKALAGEDELGAIVRAHIYIEHELMAYIQHHMPAKAIEAIELDYSGRVKLALAFGFPQEFKPALNHMGTLRNKFAHRLEAKIDKNDADNFEKSLSTEVKKIVERSYQEAVPPESKRAKSIKQLAPRERVEIYIVNLWAAAAVAVEKATQTE